ncbi:ROK family Glucokinase with ambiguous substrate specificity [Klebsiella pneumoniae]|uniref:ROK family Glucokinase with ambiguous substrate specificity n=1 Tax=Klebsiella pneumoniae TaxID=573 RepID=A0A378FM61_KLEPN|nr:ROK family Glucokinase with ambiguous substrate specificity [Klebsiella pneumoniae]
MGNKPRAEAIVAAAQNGDPRALAHWRHFIDAFARSLASVINILDPQVIVLGGGLSNVSQIYRDLPAAIVPWIFSDTCRTQIKPARFGDASGVRGRGLAAPASRRRARAAVDTFFSRYVKLGENVQTEKAMPTIDDVSRLANVSRATVSRVLTGTRGVREESRGSCAAGR